MNWFQTILDWSEVWALLIPLIVIIKVKPRGMPVRLLTIYVILAIILNGLAVFMVEYHYLVPSWLYVEGYPNNNLLYNLHSILRVTLIGTYLCLVRPYKYPVLIRALVPVYLVFVLANFIFFDDPFYLSTRLFSAESIVLLVLCIIYYFRSIQDDSQVNWLRHSSFLVATGITIYEAITFFIFLFFYPLADRDSEFLNTEFAIATMRLYTVMFIILCIMLALGLHKSKKEINPSAP
jgi:hypothetical protein